MKTRRSQAGFTLLETIVAFAIATATLTLLYQIHANAARTVSLAGEHAYATELAESLVAELEHVDGATVERSGIATDKYRWRATVRPFEGAEAADGSEPSADSQRAFSLRRIDVRITWQSRERERSFELGALKPWTISEPASGP